MLHRSAETFRYCLMISTGNPTWVDLAYRKLAKTLTRLQIEDIEELQDMCCACASRPWALRLTRCAAPQAPEPHWVNQALPQQVVQGESRPCFLHAVNRLSNFQERFLLSLTSPYIELSSFFIEKIADYHQDLKGRYAS